MAPTVDGEVNLIWLGPTSRVYDSSSPSLGIALPVERVSIKSVAEVAVASSRGSSKTVRPSIRRIERNTYFLKRSSVCPVSATENAFVIGRRPSRHVTDAGTGIKLRRAATSSDFTAI